jgi:hypothetical protein
MCWNLQRSDFAHSGLQKAMSGVLHEQVLGTCRSKGPEATNKDVMCCAMIDNGSNTLGNR